MPVRPKMFRGGVAPKGIDMRVVRKESLIWYIRYPSQKCSLLIRIAKLYCGPAIPDKLFR